MRNTLIFFLGFLTAFCIARTDTGVFLDDIFGPDDKPAIVPIPMDDEVPEWSPPPPLVLPPPLDPVLLQRLDEAVKSLDLRQLTAPMSALQLHTLTRTLAAATAGVALCPQGLVVLTPSLRGSPLESLASWLRIMAAAGLTELPTYAHGTPAWVRWRQLSTSPLTTESDWIGFYAALQT